jgi:hypothetical protein
MDVVNGLPLLLPTICHVLRGRSGGRVPVVTRPCPAAPRRACA